ncbi:helix-turn-helix domain-containing protein [Deinococcus sp. HMF7604]|uniref:helix-turn-helix transcriptional regulator n=1 Tax=Deinococcus betulae TaxID=2873312 RepID=UPI001CCF9370|nr:helix-turn-helix domain-containing protein [Deinococcus betulae]
MNEDIRAQVKKVMKERGLTQQAVADELGVDRVYVNRMLSGSTSQVPARWAEMLGLLGLRLTVEPIEGDSKKLSNS